MITSNEAAQTFLNRVLIRGYKNTIAGIEKRLSEGLPEFADDAHEITTWYKSLGEHEQNILMEVINIAVKEAIIGVLVTLDNVSGGPPLRDQISDFSLYIQSYKDSKAKAENKFIDAIRFNSIEDEELHDLFLDLLIDSEQ